MLQDNIYWEKNIKITKIYRIKDFKQKRVLTIHEGRGNLENAVFPVKPQFF